MNQMKKSIRHFTLLATFLAAAVSAAAQDIIHGYVVDQQTGDSISYASVVYKGTKEGVAGTLSGQFTIARRNGMTLTVSAVGYKPRSIKISEKTPEKLHVTLISDSKKMQEVVVKAKRRHRYTRKNNPAVELMRRVIAAKERTNLENHDFYRFDKYQKITIGANNLTPEELESKTFRDFPWLLNQVEVCLYNNKLILPVSVDETLTQHLYRKNPRSVKDIVVAQSTKGVSKLVQTGEVLNTVVKDIFKDIDLYDDQIEILQSHFPSPIGPTAISFYHFYIDDTLYVNQDQCIRLQFMPANQQDFGFRGELYVLNDSTLHVKRCDMQLPAGTGVNFVDAMKIEQEYTRLDNGVWALTTDNMVVELAITDFFSRAIVIRTTKMNNYDFGEIPPEKFKGKARIKYEADSKLKDEEFWKSHRAVELTKSERNMDDFIRQMSETKHFKWVMTGIRVLAENFIETSPEGSPSKFDIGPVNTVVSNNFIDGFRVRAGGRTTAALNPNWFWEGYYAYGLKSHENYYGTKVTYSFRKPEYQPAEFPTRTISFESTFDVMAPSDKYLLHNKDNLFMSLRPQKAEEMFFYNRQALEFKWESDAGLATELKLKTESNRPTGGVLEYRRLSDGGIVKKVRMTEFTMGLDYRPGQSYVNTKQHRIEVNLNAPQFTLSHTFGLNHFLGGEFEYNYTEASVFKRFWLGSWGTVDTRFKMGAQWNKVPYPMLIMPPVNTSYFEHQGTFNMLEEMEFLNDRFAQFNIAWDLKGKLFNRIPFLKRLKWREYVAYKGIWGHLTDKNNPFLAENADDSRLYFFPSATHVMNNEPYMELVVGVHNILKCLEVDYVRRLTYTAYPGVEVNGIRLGFNIVF